MDNLPRERMTTTNRNRYMQRTLNTGARGDVGANIFVKLHVADFSNTTNI